MLMLMLMLILVLMLILILMLILHQVLGLKNKWNAVLQPDVEDMYCPLYCDCERM